MKYFSLLLFFLINVVSKKFSFKFINTPIYKSNPFCLFHSVVLLQNNECEKLNNEKNDVFAIDFSPIEDITSPNNILKLLLGKQIQGKVRIISFPKDIYKTIFKDPFTNNLYSKNINIFEDFNSQLTNINLNKIEKIDPYLVSIIKSWGSSFQIYNRNCRNFSKFLQRQYFIHCNNDV
jgi:hypothetical protein